MSFVDQFPLFQRQMQKSNLKSKALLSQMCLHLIAKRSAGMIVLDLKEAGQVVFLHLDQLPLACNTSLSSLYNIRKQFPMDKIYTMEYLHDGKKLCVLNIFYVFIRVLHTYLTFQDCLFIFMYKTFKQQCSFTAVLFLDNNPNFYSCIT